MAIYKCNKDTERYFTMKKLNIDYYAIILAKAFIVILFVMGIISLGIELYDGTLPLPKLLI